MRSGRRLHSTRAGADARAVTSDLASLDLAGVDETARAGLETVRLVRRELAPDKALIGFCGAPWTVATYMIAGRGTPDQLPARRLALEQPERCSAR